MSKRKSTRPSLYGCDPLLVPRIKQYLATALEPRNVSISTLVDHLQMQYNEYKRKKRRPFEKSVMRAYNNALQSIGHEEDSDSGSTDVTLSDDLSSDIIEIDFPDGNLVNDSLRDLYSKNASTPFNKAASTGSANEKPNDSKSRTAITDKKNKESQEKNGVTATSNKPSHEMKNRHDTGVKSQDATPVTKKRKVITEKEASNVNNIYNKVKMKKDIQIQKSTATFSDVGGNETCIQEICKLVAHLKHPEVYERLGVSPPRGLLLHGPPGCGKTLLAHAIAGELDLPFIKIGATEIVAGISGESEEKIRDLFNTAVAHAPCVLFIDEIDSITPKRETAQREMERRIVTQLLTCLDDLNSKAVGTQVLVIGATNRPDSLDPALRRAGRFDREIRIGIPDVGARQRILEVLCRGLRLDPGFDFSQVATLTPGYVGADLMALTRESAMFAVDRAFQSIENCAPMPISSKTSENISTDAVPDSTSKSMSSVLMWLREQPPLTEEQMTNLYVEMKDFESAIKIVQPSAMREGFATVPDVTWDDIGALKEVREELKLAIMVPIRYPELYNDLGLTTPAGILLYGPPGCGKTLLAKAIANESGVNFISVKGPELLNMYVGESERAVRQCFQRAQNSAPCVIFFDELDALCPKRSDSAEGNASSRVVNQLLTEMDGIEKRRNVFILGATNRPDIIDPAVLRPGRLDKMLYVGIPTPDERLEILQKLTKNGSQPHISEDITLKELAVDDRCKSFTGADLAALIREASLLALQDIINHSAKTTNKIAKTSVARKHFEEALKKIRPSAVR